MVYARAIAPISVDLVPEQFVHDNITLKKYSREELEKILFDDEIEYWSPANLELEFRGGCWLKVDFHSKIGENEWDIAVKETELVLDSLALLKSVIGIISVAGLSVSWFNDKMERMGGNFGLENTITFPHYLLEQTELQDFDKLLSTNKTFWSSNVVTESSKEQLKRIYWAKHCYTKGFQTMKAVDRFVMFSIALEALYGGIDQELSYRYSNRAAFLLGDNLEMRKSVYKDMKETYALRCQILHGNTGWHIDPIQLLTCAEITRASILREISLYSKGFFQIGETLDRCIYDTKTHENLLLDSKDVFSDLSNYVSPKVLKIKK